MLNRRKIYLSIIKNKWLAGLLIVVLVFGILPLEWGEAADSDVQNYVVRENDTLSEISMKYKVPIADILLANDLTDTIIIAGSTLQIPISPAQKLIYLVKVGDNLSQIAEKYQTTVHVLKSLNQIQHSVIHPGDKLLVPMIPEENDSETGKIGQASFAVNTFGLNYVGTISQQARNFSQEDLKLLAKLIHAEARGESFEGKVAVGAVILNRLAHPGFPRNVRDIIFQKNQRVYQFTPVQNGHIRLEPDQDAYQAAAAALNGEDPTDGAIFFYNPKTASDKWIRTLPVTKTIGNHVFAK